MLVETSGFLRNEALVDQTLSQSDQLADNLGADTVAFGDTPSPNDKVSRWRDKFSNRTGTNPPEEDDEDDRSRPKDKDERTKSPTATGS